MLIADLRSDGRALAQPLTAGHLVETVGAGDAMHIADLAVVVADEHAVAVAGGADLACTREQALAVFRAAGSVEVLSAHQPR
jgi:hypothetical protein